MFKHPVAIMPSAPPSAAISMGKTEVAATAIVPIKISLAIRDFRISGSSTIDQSSSRRSRLFRRFSMSLSYPKRSKTSPASSLISIIRLRIIRERRCTPSTSVPVCRLKPTCSMERPIIREPGAMTTSEITRGSAVSESASNPAMVSMPRRYSGCEDKSLDKLFRVAATIRISSVCSVSSKGGSMERSPRCTMRTVTSRRLGKSPAIGFAPTRG